jgi:hypothetical protein
VGWRYGWCWCSGSKASACERFGVDDREGPGVGSSEGAEGDRIAAMECGEGIVAVRALWGPGAQRDLGCGASERGSAALRDGHQAIGNGDGAALEMVVGWEPGRWRFAWQPGSHAMCRSVARLRYEEFSGK